jgi:hypothetical protein
MRDVMEYLKKIPARVPPDLVVVHNTVRPARRLGTPGFRAWLQAPGDNLERCDCRWAPELFRDGVPLNRNAAWRRSPSNARENSFNATAAHEQVKPK